MISSDFVIVTIWVSILAYVAGMFAFSAGGQWDRAARVLWTIACGALLIHVASAFHFHHYWSHTAAYLDTARQTRELFGWNSGAGVYVNYALTIGWVTDVVWWWAAGLPTYRQRPRWLILTWHAFLFFIIFNATIVFGSPVARWAGLMVCVAIAVAWLKIAKRLRNQGQASSRDALR